ncbi:MAG: ATP-binding protein [bacterium]
MSKRLSRYISLFHGSTFLPFLICSIFTSAIPLFASDSPPSPLTLKRTYKLDRPSVSPHLLFVSERKQGESAYTVELMRDLNPPDEAGHHSRILIRDEQLHILHESNFFQRISTAYCRDISGDSIQDVIISLYSDTTAEVVMVDGKTFQVMSILDMHVNDTRWPGSSTWKPALLIMGMLQPTSNRGPVLLVSPQPGFRKKPAGLIAVDIENRKELWTYWIAGGVRGVAIHDFDGDNIEDIVFGTNASATGAQYGDTRDNECYLGMLSSDGHEIWRITFPGPFARVLPYAAKNATTHKPEIAALFVAVHPNAKPDKFLKVDPIQGSIISSQELTNWNKGENAIYEYPAGGLSPELFLLTSGPEGGVLLNSELDTITSVVNLPRIKGVFDIDDDGKPEFIGVDDLDETVILDDDFKLLGRYPFECTGAQIQYTADHDFPYLWLRVGESAHRIQIERTPFYWYELLTYLLRPMIPVFLAVIIVGPIVLLIIRRARREIKRARSEQEKNVAMRAIVRVVGHEMGFPLDLLKKASFNLRLHFTQSNDDIPEDVQECLQDLKVVNESLSDTSQELRKFVGLERLKLEPIYLGKLIQELMNNYRRDDVVIEVQIESNLPPIHADRKQMQSLVNNLLKNALTAMREGDRLTIRAFSSEEFVGKRTGDHFVNLIIEDTGSGIPKKYHHRIFEPDFTLSKHGTGLGLAFVKNIITAHEGTIQFESLEGSGTTFHITLPILKEEN